MRYALMDAVHTAVDISKLLTRSSSRIQTSGKVILERERERDPKQAVRPVGYKGYHTLISKC